MNRFQAFLIHLGISLSVFGVLAYLVMTIWYPGFFFDTDGGWQGLRLLLGVDLVLGPLLTLIVYRKGKPGLRSDLTIIGIVQVTCLAAGVWIVHGERPLAIVFVDGSFYSVSAQSFKEVDVPVPDLEVFPGKSPKWISVKLPEGAEEQSTIRGAMLRNDRMLATLSEHYVPFQIDDMDQRDARKFDDIMNLGRNSEAMQSWVAANGETASTFRYFLFGARYTYGYLGFDPAQGRFAGFLNTLAIL